jgi:dipeptidase E
MTGKDLRLLLLSNSTMPGEPYFTWPQPHVSDFLGRGVRTVAFVPYAGVTITWDDYAAEVGDRFAKLGYALMPVHRTDDPKKLVENADAVAVGGGNTFHLLAKLYETGLLEAIGARVRDGAPYIGWSAGSNVACPTIRTTNDMPIVQPPSFEAFGFVPFQLNPHFVSGRLPGQTGESREDRIAEFVRVNAGTWVVGLREGTALRREGAALTLVGGLPAKVFRHGREARECEGEDALAFLLE